MQDGPDQERQATWNELALRAQLRSNLSELRSNASQIHRRALRKAHAINTTLLVLSGSTAGGFWFLLTDSRHIWLAAIVKWGGALSATIVAILAAYRDRIVDHGAVEASSAELVRTLDMLIFETEDGKPLSSINRRYRATKADIRALADKMGLGVAESQPPRTHSWDDPIPDHVVMEAKAIRRAKQLAKSGAYSVEEMRQITQAALREGVELPQLVPESQNQSDLETRDPCLQAPGSESEKP